VRLPRPSANSKRLVALYKWNAAGGVATLWTAATRASAPPRGLLAHRRLDRALFAKHAATM
jgi:hypothetical protein